MHGGLQIIKIKLKDLGKHYIYCIIVVQLNLDLLN